MASSFTCNLVENARKHKCFLERIHELGVSTVDTTTTNASIESLRRYQHLWLPLAHQHSHHQQLIPPPDIAWLWHCHRLAPRNYATYCKQTFATAAATTGGSSTVLVEANPPFTLQVAPTGDDDTQQPSIAKTTRQLWSNRYPNEPFFLLLQEQPMVDENTDTAATEKKKGKFALPATLLCGFDLLGSTERQATFLWQVSAERFEDDDFLEEGVENYTRFLKLKAKATAQNTILVPTYQIDLIWHTHILSSITDYDKDCKAISGGTLHHDDSLTDRSDGGVLDVSYTATKKLWKSEYGCDYVVVGGMYRGEPPLEYFASEWRSWQHKWEAEANQHLVGRMGASSTSPPTKWATTDGLTSQGLQAFIPTGTTRKHQLVTQMRRDDYVLGKTTNGTGYFHIETMDANTILYSRARRRAQSLESDIACSRACCNGNTPTTRRKEKELEDLMECVRVLAERCRSSQPVVIDRSRNATSGSATAANSSSVYYDDNGAWLYPTMLYHHAGGACGGAVACHRGAGCGGSACGAACGGGDGGDGGGGGCGGGGCGGGG